MMEATRKGRRNSFIDENEGMICLRQEKKISWINIKV